MIKQLPYHILRTTSSSRTHPCPKPSSHRRRHAQYHRRAPVSPALPSCHLLQGFCLVAALGAKYAEAGCCHKDKIDECEIRCAEKTDTNPDGARVGLT
ncbi:hypothetical protein V2G26_010289 [Clonostachys chloroleuca]